MNPRYQHRSEGTLRGLISIPSSIPIDTVSVGGVAIVFDCYMVPRIFLGGMLPRPLEKYIVFEEKDLTYRRLLG